MKAVRFDEYGGPDVLRIEDLPMPEPAAAQVLVKVKAAGINPGEASIRKGLLAKQYPTTFPSGEGSDFSGIITAVGASVSSFKEGDEVVGFTNNRGSHAEYVLAEEKNIIKRPENVSWEEGGSIFVAGSTAWACVHAVDVKSGDTVVVSGAAGGVGSIVVQLAKEKGAKVIGLAGESNQQWLNDQGITGIVYGDGQLERIREATDGKVDAFIDTFGKGYIDLALELGVAKDRINTIIDFEGAAKHGVKTDGSAKAANAGVLAELVSLISAGKLKIPIAKKFPLDQVKEAYSELEQRHTHGKIVLIP